MVIRDEANAARLERDGFFVAPFISAGKIEQLKKLFDSFFREEDLPPIFDSLSKIPASARKMVHQAILAICEENIGEVLSDFKAVIAMYYAKKTGENSAVGLHIDPSMTVEDYNHIGIWIPLEDSDESTGKMCFLKSSHHFIMPYHGLKIPSPYSKITALVLPQMTCLHVRKGEAVVFDNNLVHYSQKNISGKTRIAIIVKIIDKNAPLVSAFLNEQGTSPKIDLFRHKDDYYVSDDWNEESAPASSEYMGTADYEPVCLDEDGYRDLLEKIAREPVVKEEKNERLYSKS